MQKAIKTLKKKWKNFPVTKPGFTLVEILIVVAVIGILFVTLVSRIDFAGDKARETGVKTNSEALNLRLNSCCVRMPEFPNTTRLLNFVRQTAV